MYPAEELLQEVGRVTIAGSRLDVQLSYLWWHLDPQHVDQARARRASGSAQSKAVRQLTGARLTGALGDAVLAALEEADDARELRNEVVHQDWVLRGPDALRTAAEVSSVATEDLSSYLDEWEREAVASEDWRRLPARAMALVPTQPLEDLRLVERRLAAVAARVQALVFAVASARDTGMPAGYVHAG